MNAVTGRSPGRENLEGVGSTLLHSRGFTYIFSFNSHCVLVRWAIITPIIQRRKLVNEALQKVITI